MIALSLFLALLPAAPEAQAGRPPAAPASAPAPAATPATAPAPAPAPAPPAPRATVLKLEGLPADVVGFLTPGRGTSSIDGGSRLPWDGPGGSLVRSSWDALDKRAEQVRIADAIIVSINEAVQEFYESGGEKPGKVRAALEPAAASLDVALAAYQKALEFEERRLYLVKKATAIAEQSKDPIPGIDPDLVDRRLAALLDGRISSALELRIKGYRSLTGGLVAFIDGESLTALEQMKAAAEALPDMAVAQAYLGSLYFLFQQTDPAVAAWKRALALDPNNDAVRAALKEYGRKGR